ncbi:MAG TPA: hypothetical protein VF367_01280 [Candidatus Limnocylindria bacterium]|jgi:hypothetical protein
MSREERRAYQRQMKNMERGATLPPAARARVERNAQRRARRGGGGVPAGPGAFTTRFLVRAIGVAVVLGFVAFSLQWGSGMPTALYVGLAVTAIALVLAFGFRLLQRRAAASAASLDRPSR